jgi:hypothetical protein
MKTREVTITTGQKFTVPQGIQRLDSASTRGWQVRYQGTKYFPDGTVGPEKALGTATRELLRRIGTLPAPVGLRRAPSPSKTSGLPAGISGPILVNRSGTPSAVLSVLVPRFGKTNLVKKLYIGTPQTYSKGRFQAAVAQAVELRAESLALYESAATKAKRKEASTMKKTLSAGRGGA